MLPLWTENGASSRYAPASFNNPGSKDGPVLMPTASQRGITVLKCRVVYGVFFWLALVAGLVSTSHAFTLGDLRGSVIVGRSLDLSVAVQAGPEEDISAPCFAAEVFHADTQQAPATITVSPQPSAAGASFKVRIQSRALVDEPVVTVQLRSTCATLFTRRYVVLADFPVVVMPQAEPAELLPVAPAVSPAPLPAAAQSVAVPGSDAATSGALAKTPSAAPMQRAAKSAAARKPRAARKKATAAAPRAAKKPAVVAPPVALPEPAKSALKLETLNLPSGQADGLGATPLSLPSPESLLQARQIEALQEEIKALKNLTVKNNAALMDMQVQLQKAQSERVSLQLFYVVLALLLMCVAVLLWLLWQRYHDEPSQDAGASILTEMAVQASERTDTSDLASRADAGRSVPPSEKSAQSWWHAESTPDPVTPVAPVAKNVASVAPTQPAAKPVVPATLQDLNNAFTNTRLQDVGDSNFGVIAHEDVDLDIDMSSWAGLDESAKSEGSSAESILDIRQQAEFFVSLGQTERALFVLKKQIAEGERPNPFIYLDLLSLFHSLGYKTDFREYRAAFNRHFNCVLPDFPAYHLEGLDLMAYTDELARLAQVWNRKEVIAYLTACIYRSEQASAQPSFELAAFRDLLLLFSIAEQLVGKDET